MILKKKLYLFLIFMLLIITVSAQEDTIKQKQKMFDFAASYKGDFAGNVTGGISKGFGYLGYGTLGVAFNTETAHWWKGGHWVLSGATTHGNCPTEEWLGDFQVADNIEAGNHIFLQELYFLQEIGPAEIVAGLNDFNALYAFTDHQHFCCPHLPYHILGPQCQMEHYRLAELASRRFRLAIWF